MYYQDLENKEFGMKAIGWLDKHNDFPKGDVSQDIIEKLRGVKPRFLTAGHHVCEFCFPDGKGYSKMEDATSSYEIHICSKEGQVYVAPRMIIHYMKVHNYLPPQEYIDAVINGYTTNDAEYGNAIHETIERIRTYLKSEIDSRKNKAKSNN